MTETKPGPADNRAQEPASSLPDDEEQSVYRFIIVAAKRARQLQGGARPRIASHSRKVTRIALEEVRRGLVEYLDPATTPPPVEEETFDQ